MKMRVADLAQALNAEAEGNLDLAVRRPAAPAEAGPEDIAMAMEPGYAEAAAASPARVGLLWPGADWKALGFEAAIFAPRSRYVMAGVTRAFDQPLELEPGIHPTAWVHPEAELGEDVHVGPFVAIGRGAVIGAGARIHSHVSIAERVRIGVNCLLMPGVRLLRDVRIGDRFIAQANAVIGGDGFSYVTPGRGSVEEAKASGHVSEGSKHNMFARIQSLGAVAIGDDVEIGAGACIDRGTITDTRIGDGTKIDNLVQLGHNCQVGRACLLCGLVGVAGSVTIEDRVVLGGKVGVPDHVTIGHDVVVGGGSLLAGGIEPNQVVMGVPAMPKKTAAQVFILTRRLPELFRMIRDLEKRVSKSEGSR